MKSFKKGATPGQIIDLMYALWSAQEGITKALSTGILLAPRVDTLVSAAQRMDYLVGRCGDMLDDRGHFNPRPRAT